MSDSIYKDVNFSLKVVINKQKTKVLFAVIDNYFADVLFSFLTLPLGKIVRVLEKHYGDEVPIFGSVTTLYRGLSNLDEAYFCGEGCREMLLNPASSFRKECRKIKLDIGENHSTNYFWCGHPECVSSEKVIIGMYHASVRCYCRSRVNKEILLAVSHDVGEVFTQNTSNFVLSDDLEILPNETASVTQIFSSLGVFDIDGAECRNVTFGFNEVMDLLKWALLTRTPLTNLILKKQWNFVAVPFQIEKIGTPDDAALTVKVVFRKSSNKILFVEAEEDFVEFLFSLLIFPLGKVESLLGGNTCLKTMDNLYRSLTSPVDSKYLRKRKTARLINQTVVPHGYLSKFRIFSLDEKGPPNFSPSVNWSYKSPKGEGNYVKSPSKYMVKDDLTVTPVCMASYISTIIEKKIPLSDVDEQVLKILLQEASSILNASLSSTCALSNGLGHLLRKNPKLEL